jgi:PPK2 family polyphosphate:nucleotide phosphotransferase
MDTKKLIKRLLVPYDKKISLTKDYDPAYLYKGVDKDRAGVLLAAGIQKLAEFQDKMYAQNTHALLIIFQAIDAAGKDGAIKHVMSGVNPQGCQVFSFKAPSSVDLDHDYLWRCFTALPERGRIGIFNRSYYEEVVAVRVHPELLQRQQLPAHLKNDDLWKRRFEEINSFEKYLTDNAIHVVKIFLNVSKEKQRTRFLARLDTPEKNWKFSVADVQARQYWDDYISAYQKMLNATSTKWAPWYVVPADNKWFSRTCVAAIIYEKLKSLGLRYPEVDPEQLLKLNEARQLLESEAPLLSKKARRAATA